MPLVSLSPSAKLSLLVNLIVTSHHHNHNDYDELIKKEEANSLFSLALYVFYLFFDVHDDVLTIICL